MPSYPLTFPPTPKFNRFLIRKVHKTPRSESPFTGEPQVLEHSNSGRWIWDATIPPIREGEADVDTWIAFLNDLHGRYGTFTLNIQTHSATIDYASGLSGLPTLWRSRDGQQGWEWDRNRLFNGVLIRAEEAS